MGVTFDNRAEEIEIPSSDNNTPRKMTEIVEMSEPSKTVSGHEPSTASEKDLRFDWRSIGQQYFEAILITIMW